MVSIRLRSARSSAATRLHSLAPVHGHRCRAHMHSLHVPTIELLDDTVESVENLAAFGRDSITEDHPAVYAGLLGTSGQSEIDQDVRRLKAAGLITEKVAQYLCHVCRV